MYIFNPGKDYVIVLSSYIRFFPNMAKAWRKVSHFLSRENISWEKKKKKKVLIFWNNMKCVWYFGGIWCKVTEHRMADTGLALGDSGESNLTSPLPGELG